MRKFFAVILIFFGTLIMAPLTLLIAMEQTFLNEDRIQQRIIPASYELVIDSVAQGFAENMKNLDETATKQLFERRIRTALSKENYVLLGRTMVDTVLESLRTAPPATELIVDLQPLRDTLQKILPQILAGIETCKPEEMRTEQFMFCKPSEISDGELAQTVQSIFMREVPMRYVVRHNELPTIIPSLQTILLRGNLFVVSYIITLAIYLGMIMFVIWRPLFLAMRWAAYAIAPLSAFIILGSKLLSRGATNPKFLTGGDLSDVQIQTISMLLQQFANTLMSIGLWHVGAVFVFWAIAFALQKNHDA